MITISPGPRSTCYRGEDEKNRIILSVTRLIRAQAGKGGVKVSLLFSTAEEKKERERERERGGGNLLSYASLSWKMDKLIRLERTRVEGKFRWKAPNE